ncbi:hypothetical protein PoB_002129600 [Plakobranchus ocellatus]|uniref:Uncharacterized protein n=1 Tax=Plakobranchus ocellatus TaxID=259542 RepID=A0AAV3Z643_9GAST|nr:hypothetical protein PoB_002129600 [Plakobranchus ocellatus]
MFRPFFFTRSPNPIGLPLPVDTTATRRWDQWLKHLTMMTWKKDPDSILCRSVFCLPQLPIPSIEFERPPMLEDKETFSFLAVIAQGFVNALKAQVSDLMAEEPSTSASSFAPATNLICEHGLGC